MGSTLEKAVVSLLLPTLPHALHTEIRVTLMGAHALHAEIRVMLMGAHVPPPGGQEQATASATPRPLGI